MSDSMELTVVEDLDRVLMSSPDQQEAWLFMVGDALKHLGSLRSQTLMSEGEILWTVFNVWERPEDIEEGTSYLARNALVRWEHDFYTWAGRFTQRSAREPAQRTINNRMAVYRDWVATDTIAHPDTVPIPVRDPDGEPIPEKWEDIEFDPMQIDFSKLLYARGAARRGDMSPEAWTALTDPYASAADLLRELRQPEENDEDDEEIPLSIFYDNGVFYAQRSGITVAFARLIPEELDSNVARDAVTNLFGVYGLNTPEELILHVDVEIDAPIASRNADGLLLTTQGQRFALIDDIDQLKLIRSTVDEVLESFYEGEEDDF